MALKSKKVTKQTLFGAKNFKASRFGLLHGSAVGPVVGTVWVMAFLQFWDCDVQYF